MIIKQTSNPGEPLPGNNCDIEVSKNWDCQVWNFHPSLKGTVSTTSKYSLKWSPASSCGFAFLFSNLSIILGLVLSIVHSELSPHLRRRLAVIGCGREKLWSTFRTNQTTRERKKWRKSKCQVICISVRHRLYHWLRWERLCILNSQLPVLQFSERRADCRIIMHLNPFFFHKFICLHFGRDLREPEK